MSGSARTAYEHPGKSFIASHGTPESIDSVLEYARFLREESGLTDDPPINLRSIFERFAIPEPRRARLPAQQGLLMNPETGLIIINERDIDTRQRFTEAHELMELFFAAFRTGGAWAARQHGPFKTSSKEALCNRGAAELLMPRSSYLPRVAELGPSFATGRRLAVQYDVSMTAALVQMSRIGPGSHAVVLWSRRNKPSELSHRSGGRQLSLFGSQSDLAPQPRLRVEWSIPTDGGPFIPKHKSAPVGSAPVLAWETGEDTEGEDYLALGQVLGHVFSENRVFESDTERMVISLLHLPDDHGCKGAAEGRHS